MFAVPYEKHPLSNFDVLERLAAAWNPPEVSGRIQLVEGRRPDTLHVCFTGRDDGRDVMVFGNAIGERLFCDPAQRKALARSLKDFFGSALPPACKGATATGIRNPL